MLRPGGTVEEQLGGRCHRAAFRVEQESADRVGDGTAAGLSGCDRLVAQCLYVVSKVSQLRRFAAAFDTFKSYKKRHKTVSYVVINVINAKI